MADRADYPAESTAMSTVAAVPPAFDALIQALREPSCYPHPVETVRVVETHISCVLLAGEFAYKLKKPVDLGFLDFSTLERRRHFCEEELRLNRRTAPQLYLDAVSYTHLTLPTNREV